MLIADTFHIILEYHTFHPRFRLLNKAISTLFDKKYNYKKINEKVIQADKSDHLTHMLHQLHDAKLINNATSQEFNCQFEHVYKYDYMLDGGVEIGGCKFKYNGQIIKYSDDCTGSYSLYVNEDNRLYFHYDTYGHAVIDKTIKVNDHVLMNRVLEILSLYSMSLIISSYDEHCNKNTTYSDGLFLPPVNMTYYTAHVFNLSSNKIPNIDYYNMIITSFNRHINIITSNLNDQESSLCEIYNKITNLEFSKMILHKL
jgi:hypothetical protein